MTVGLRQPFFPSVYGADTIPESLYFIKYILSTGIISRKRCSKWGLGPGSRRNYALEAKYRIDISETDS